MSKRITPQNPSGLCLCGCGQITAIASRTLRGYAKGESQRYINGHNSRKNTPEYKINSDGCWVWQWGRDACGYGLKKTKGRTTRAHRYYYEQAKGKIPDGLQIDHLCRNTSCVNPAHLEAVTPAENARRGNNTKLTLEDVQEIRRHYLEGDVTQTALSIKHKISVSHINRIVRGQSWFIPA